MDMHRWVESVVREGSIKVLEVAITMTEVIAGEAWIMLNMKRLEKDKQEQRRLHMAAQLQEEALKNRNKSSKKALDIIFDAGQRPGLG